MARKQMTEAERERAAKRREEGLEQRHALFVEACEAMRTSEQWTRYLAFMARFHTYSPRNVMLILAQCEHATQVAGYERWRELGRQVRKGEAGLRILGGSRRMVKREDPVTGEIERVQIFRTFNTSVWDISQTDPIEGFEPVEHPARPLTGEDTQGTAAAVEAWLTANGWSVEVADLDAANGRTSAATRTVTFAPHLEPAQRAKTALHELAHILCEHFERMANGEDVHRGRFEVEAESVAYLVSCMLGVSTDDYSVGYVTDWAHAEAAAHDTTPADVMLETARRVRAVAGDILAILRPDAAEDEDAANAAA